MSWHFPTKARKILTISNSPSNGENISFFYMCEALSSQYCDDVVMGTDCLCLCIFTQILPHSSWVTKLMKEKGK